MRTGEARFKELKDEYGGRVRPPNHPDSVRVHAISNEIIEALNRGLKVDDRVQDAGKKKVEKKKKKANVIGHYVKDFKWEVVVMDRPYMNAFCLPGGKNVVFTGLFKHFKSDAEIATIVGHEVGHAVARHTAEKLFKHSWIGIVKLGLILSPISATDVEWISNFLLANPFSRKMEMEADYIGLMLMASAGYDPRVAPTVYEKLGKLSEGESATDNYLSTHPSGKKRSRLLARAHVMKEALALYNQTMAGRETEGFIE